MALYGLSVFSETPKPLRPGAKVYIYLSFLITSLVGLVTSFDMAWLAEQGLEPVTKSYVRDFGEEMRWEQDVSMGLRTVIFFVGDAFLVGGL